MKLNEILDLWEQDSEVDQNDLSTASIDTAKLHSKYLRLLIDAKLRKTKITADNNILRHTKVRYYRGELTREELNNQGWEPYQYKRPLKAEMEDILKGDADLSNAHAKLDYLDTMIQALEAILGQLKSRDWQIRNAISFKQLLAGN